MDRTRLLAGLDADQRRAVTEPGSLLCILAGAGSGKTRVLTRRIALRSAEGLAEPRHVLAVTFTRKAATEMGSRLAALGLRDRPTVGTFHALAWGQLRTHWHDQGRPLPALLERKGRVLAALPGRGRLSPSELATEIEWARARLVPTSDYARAAHQADRRVGASLGQVQDLIQAYETEKRRRGVVDFDDILALCADALETDAAFAAAQRWRFRHLFVDEYQDLNPLQHRLLEAWRGGRDDLCVVGDPRQAIYGWNGADARYLTRFAEDHPGAQVITLTRNYRSTPQILGIATAALGRSQVSAQVATRPPGELPTIVRHASDVEEARALAAAARLLHGPGTRWARQAVLVRTNAQMPLIEQALVAARIPFRLRGGLPLLDRPEVREALDRLRGARGRPLGMALDDIGTLAEELEVAGALEKSESLAAVVRLGRELESIEPQATTGDLRPWIATAVGADGADHSDAIDVVTFHAAKGLEWPVVHVLGLEDGLVPISHARSPEAEAEERRLLHVALTRAEDVLRCSWAEQRTWREVAVERRPSPYLAAMADALVDLHAAHRPSNPTPGLAQARAALSKAVRRTDDGTSEARRALTTWRDATARRAGVSPAVVMSDVAVAAVARARPTDLPALAEVPGMGPLSVEAYGEAIIETVRAALEPPPLVPDRSP